MLGVMAVLVAVPAVAQPGDYGLDEDSRGLAADAVPLPVERLETACDPFGLRVVRDSAELRTVERFRGCDASAFPALGRELYVHVRLSGDCHARFGVEAWRSESRREYRVVMLTESGYCRAGRFESWWVRLPPLPEGWTVGFTDWNVDQRGQPLRPDALGVAEDAVPLAIRAEPIDGCSLPGYGVVRGHMDVHDTQDRAGCGTSTFQVLGRALYVRLAASDRCGSQNTVRAYRSEARREFRVVRTARSRRCENREDGPRWFRLPPLPQGWTVAFTETAA
jgi:hypothetical protein